MLQKTLRSVVDNPKHIFKLAVQGIFVGIFAAPSEPNKITFLSKVARPSTVVGFPTPKNTSRVILKKNLMSTVK